MPQVGSVIATKGFDTLYDAEASALAAGRPQAAAAGRPQGGRRAAAGPSCRAAAGRAWATRIACFLSRGEPEEARRDFGETKNRNPALGLSPPYDATQCQMANPNVRNAEMGMRKKIDPQSHTSTGMDGVETGPGSPEPRRRDITDVELGKQVWRHS